LAKLTARGFTQTGLNFLLVVLVWKAALAVPVALVTIGPLSITHNGIAATSAAPQEILIREADIARLKTALRLTPEQEVRWRSVEIGLHEFARQKCRFASADGYFAGSGGYGISGYTLNAVMLHRVKSAAQPLIRMLSEEQKQAAMSMLHSMGAPF
jgi:hypothetical protein